MQYKKLLVYNKIPGLSRSETILLICAERVKMARQVIRVSDLVNILEIPASSVSRSLRSLEEKGMLKRKQSDKDRRVTLVILSASGEKELESHRRKMFGKMDRLIDRFGKERTEALIRLMDAFYAEAEAFQKQCAQPKSSAKEECVHESAD